jgi:ADP-heptose:LPS heptosyltransferase
VPCQRIPDVRRIAVVRANAVGDFVVTLPALDALRAAYPDARITLVGAPWHDALLRDRPGPVDDVVVAPQGSGLRPGDDPGACQEFFDAMQAEQFDLAVQLHGGGRHANPFTRRLGARVAVGLRAYDAPALDRDLPYVHYQPEVLRFLEVVKMVGAPPVGLEPRLTATRRDHAAADDALGGADPGPLAVLHPGAMDPRRRWPPERFAAVGDALAAHDLSVVVVGSDREAPIGAAVVGAMQSPALDLTGRTSLPALVGLLDRAAIVVANDSGPRHLAEAVGTPTVAVYWVGNLITSAPLTRRRHRPLISWTTACPVCGVSCVGDPYPARAGGVRCEHDLPFVTDVPVAYVLRAVTDLLGEIGARELDGVAGAGHERQAP